jgi:hypothetical protein
MKKRAMIPNEELHACLERMAHWANQLEACAAIISKNLPAQKAQEMQQTMLEIRRALRGLGIVFKPRRKS